MKKKSVIGYIIGILLMMVGVMGGFYGRKKIVQEQIAELVAKARAAMEQIADYDQEQANTLVKAAACSAR